MPNLLKLCPGNMATQQTRTTLPGETKTKKNDMNENAMTYTCMWKHVRMYEHVCDMKHVSWLV